ncbi:MAG TPA: hypothetical protein VMT87_10235 [Vicinamibacteria bacterium]|nr:hypothetical protein [Vicinamibacteria bacterium]
MPPCRALLASLAAGVCALACGKELPPPAADRAVLQRQRDGLAALLKEAEAGPLVPFDKVLVVVDQALVQDLLVSAMPYERVIARYRIRVTGASVRFEDGFALVRLDGRASLAGRSEAAAFADVSVFGGLDVLEVDPESGLLRGEVRVIAVDARRVMVMGVGAPEDAEELIEELGHERLDAFGALASRLQIPVRLERAVTLPAVGPEGGVRIAAASIPLQIAVRQVRALRGKLWISIDAAVGGDGSPRP